MSKPNNQVHMDICDLLNLKVQEQSQMIGVLEKEISTFRETQRRKEKQFEDFRVDAAKALAKAVQEGRESLAKLFKEKLKTKQLEESQRKILSQFTLTRQQDVDTIVEDLNLLKTTSQNPYPTV
ncbi:hypothetical protein BCR33DRAFT_789040 [Rhizoclosmatium globosum]|uniref:Uncharacterized protein n=1 Tax=Rhizoclosmatium globosum TaxID=329046 RepID=A0A1Y2BVJ2_9FUNG|nr:hypothetical protein BCR33DRAFT_789040 [Rhizoclosmatium globosum]|eukprot:ORY38115.1 hypothetical protein BCR33DRAFT_789040 [Rhizoclosmatium globosum]